MSLDDAIGALTDILGRQRDIYKGLIALSEQKKEAILDGKVALLDKLVKEEQEPLTVLRELERKRKLRLEELAAALGKPAADVTIHDVLAVCPVELTAALRRVQEELTETLRAQVSVNEVVKKLIETRLEYISFMMDMNSSDYTNSYDAGAGDVRKKNQGARIIDLGV
ncbi:hypothetical protein FACS1894208_04610 [Clostridia bacterium]|nr:hypothetical protein FACS1894208_04610 [Clostridia bacterium]